MVRFPHRGIWESNSDIVLLGTTLFSLTLFTWKADKTIGLLGYKFLVHSRERCQGPRQY